MFFVLFCVKGSFLDKFARFCLHVPLIVAVCLQRFKVAQLTNEWLNGRKLANTSNIQQSILIFILFVQARRDVVFLWQNHGNIKHNYRNFEKS